MLTPFLKGYLLLKQRGNRKTMFEFAGVSPTLSKVFACQSQTKVQLKLVLFLFFYFENETSLGRRCSSNVQSPIPTTKTFRDILKFSMH